MLAVPTRRRERRGEAGGYQRFFSGVQRLCMFALFGVLVVGGTSETAVLIAQFSRKSKQKLYCVMSHYCTCVIHGGLVALRV